MAQGNRVIRPQDPVREGYTFDGWYLDAEGTQAYDFATPVTGDLTLFAKWTKVETNPTPGGDNGGSSQGGGNSGGSSQGSGNGGGSNVGGGNSNSSIPDTGDTHNLFIPMATLACAMAGVVVLTVTRRKAQK